MTKKEKRWQSVVALLRRWTDRGVVEPGQLKELVEAIAEIKHARRTKNWKRQDRAFDKLARIFLRCSDGKR